MEKNEIKMFNEQEKKVYCSISANTLDEKKKLFNALEECDVLLNDCVGEEIRVKDVYVEEKQIVDESTGEIKPKFRTILFDENGKTYATGSYGVYNAVAKITLVFGLPSEWEEPITVKVAKRKIADGKSVLTLVLI